MKQLVPRCPAYVNGVVSTEWSVEIWDVQIQVEVVAFEGSSAVVSPSCASQQVPNHLYHIVLAGRH